MTPWRCAATALLLGAGWGCAASNEPTFALSAVSPNMAFNDAPLALTVTGKPFRPAYRFDTMAGAAATEAGTYSVTLTSTLSSDRPTPISVQLDAVKWQSPYALLGMIPAGTPEGTYDVTVIDPRGQSRELPQAFTSLGMDHEPPTITLLAPEPRTIVAAGTTITIVLSADDGHGFLDTLDVEVSTDGEPHLLSHHCPVVPPMGKVPCYFPVTAPAPVSASDKIVIAARAVDSVGNPTLPNPVSFSFPLAARPSASGLSPMIGPSRGGTEIIVTGTDFVAATDESRGTELLFDGVMVMPEMVSPTVLRAVTPPHDAGPAQVRVVTGSAQTDPPLDFEYVAAPAVKLVSPSHGPVTGGTRIAIAGNHFRDPGTTFFAGGGLLRDDVCFVSDNRAEATMPAGTVPGPVVIFAYDEIGGTGALQGVFTYDPADAPQPDLPDGGGLEPMLCPTGVP